MEGVWYIEKPTEEREGVAQPDASCSETEPAFQLRTCRNACSEHTMNSDVGFCRFQVSFGQQTMVCKKTAGPSPASDNWQLHECQ